MEDKQIIEEMEMAREIYNALLNCHDNFNCYKCEFRHDAPFCKAEYIAKAISEHYQPKLPKDSLVLTGLELADYKYYKEYTKSLAMVEKETREKILNELKSLNIIDCFSIIEKYFKEQFGVEIKD